MNLEKRFIEISNFLEKHLLLIDTEALGLAGNSPVPYNEWSKEIDSLSDQEKINLENMDDISLIKNKAYISYLNEISELTSIKKAQLEPTPLDKELGKKISKKKKHEISLITQYLKDKNFLRAIDVGSGAAHLSSVLVANGLERSICIDSSAQYQRIGKEKLKKYAPEILEKITFENKYIDHNSEFNITQNDLLIGLHSCGDLSVELLQAVLQKKKGSLLNYGCCYHKLSPFKLNLSSQAKKKNLLLNNVALTLAAKGHKPQTKESFKQKIMVKTFRYALHLLNLKLLGEGFKTLGNATKSDYAGSFIDYVTKYSPSTVEKISEKKVVEFYESQSVQQEINSLLSLGIIRSQLARIVEIYIILDRALYLQENGMDVEVIETFDRSLSPRNISIYAYTL